MKRLSVKQVVLPPASSWPRWPFFDRDEVAAASKVLESGNVNYWTGVECRSFEREFADCMGVKYALPVMNGTVALEAALHALGISPGDEVIVTPRTFIASASCAVMRGAIPIFADVDHESQNITAKSIEAVIGPKTRAIIAVHLAGWPCDMDSILETARKHNLKVVEDCAQAHGAEYNNQRVGSFGDVAAFSFCQDKIMTTAGEGGMITTNDSQIWEQLWAYKDHGKSYDAVYNREHQPGFRWLHESFGTNLRMTEVQAAIGRLQLRKLNSWLEARKRNACVLTDGFSRIPGLRVTVPPEKIRHAYYKYYVFIEPFALKRGWSRDRIMNELIKDSIPCGSGSCSEIYLERAFRGTSYEPQKPLPVAKELGETSLMFMVHPTLSKDDMESMVQAVKRVMKIAVR